MESPDCESRGRVHTYNKGYVILDEGHRSLKRFSPAMKGTKKIAVVGVILLSVIGGLAALRSSLTNRVEIRGTLSRDDVAEITRLHRAVCPTVWLGVLPKWLSISVRRHVSGILNPIEVIAVPEDGKAIVVYREFERYFYDKKGKHRWGHASYPLVKDAKGWHESFILP